MLSIQVIDIAVIPIRRLAGLVVVPSVHFPHRVFRVAATVLQAAFELVLASANDVEVIVVRLPN